MTIAGEIPKASLKVFGSMEIPQHACKDQYVGDYKPNPKSLTSFILGTVQESKGHYRESLSAFDKAIALDPKFAAAYVQRGQSLLALDDHKGAMVNLSKAIQLAPTDFEAYRLRGRIYFERGQYSKAISDFSVAIKYAKSPNDKASMFKMRGKMYACLGTHDLAIVDFTKSISLKPLGSRAAFLLRGNQYFAVKQYQKAVDDYTKSIAVANSDERNELYSLRAKAYEKLGKHDLARQDRAKAKDSVKDGWGDVLRDMDKRGF